MVDTTSPMLSVDLFHIEYDEFVIILSDGCKQYTCCTEDYYQSI